MSYTAFTLAGWSVQETGQITLGTGKRARVRFTVLNRLEEVSFKVTQGGVTSVYQVDERGEASYECPQAGPAAVSVVVNFADSRRTAIGVLEEIDEVGGSAVVTPAISPIPSPPNADPRLSLSLSPASQNEGNSGLTPYVATLTLNRDGSTLAYPFTWQVAPRGFYPADAADFGGSLPAGGGTFAAGETVKTWTINVSGDTTIEPGENFALVVTCPLAQDVERRGHIRNDDFPADTSVPLDALLNDQGGYIVNDQGGYVLRT